MSLVDDPTITPEAHDQARLWALEHLVASLWYFLALSRAGQSGVSIGDTAAQLRESVKSTMIEGELPAEFLALARAHAVRVMDAAVVGGRNADELRPRDT